MLQAEYWRLIEDGEASFSNFDHQQIYGLPVAIDAIEELRKRIFGREVVEALHDQETGDLVSNHNQHYTPLHISIAGLSHPMCLCAVQITGLQCTEFAISPLFYWSSTRCCLRRKSCDFLNTFIMER
jgi:hypothetical protein